MKYYEDESSYSENNKEYVNLNGRNVIRYDELSPNQKKSLNRFFGCITLFFAMPFLLAGIAFLYVGVTQYHAEEDKNTQCTELIVGTITYKNFKEHYDFDENGKYKGYTRSYSGPRYVEYTYNGQEYRIKCENQAKERNLNLHDEIEVYVDPSDPQHMYFPGDIEVKKEGFLELALVGGIIVFVFFTLFFIKIIIHFIKKCKQKNSEMTDLYY